MKKKGLRGGGLRGGGLKRKGLKSKSGLSPFHKSSNPRSVLVSKLDRAFSNFIRTKYQRPDGRVKCFTCPAVLPYNIIQCGHFVSRKYEEIRWDPDNARPQCERCNCFEDGKPDVFEEKLRKEIGDDRVDELKQSDRYFSYSTEELKSKLESLLKD